MGRFLNWPLISVRACFRSAEALIGIFAVEGLILIPLSKTPFAAAAGRGETLQSGDGRAL